MLPRRNVFTMFETKPELLHLSTEVLRRHPDPRLQQPLGAEPRDNRPQRRKMIRRECTAAQLFERSGQRSHDGGNGSTFACFVVADVAQPRQRCLGVSIVRSCADQQRGGGVEFGSEPVQRSQTCVNRRA